MPYGRIKIDTVTFTDGGSDRSIVLSGLVNLVSGSLSASGAISIDLVRANTVSGATVTGDAGSFATLTATTGNINTLVSSGLVSGTVARFNSITGNALKVNANINTSTITGFSCFFTTGQVLGTLTTSNISTNSVNASAVTATVGTFNTLSGGTATGNTYNVTTINAVTGKYTSLSGTTVTGDYLNATSGHFNTITVDAPSTFNTDLSVNQKATIATGSFTTIERVNILSGGSAALPAINISGSIRTNGIYKGSNDSLSVVTSGIAHINISPRGYVGIGGNVDPDSYSFLANNLVISGSSNEGLIIDAGAINFASILFTAPDKSYKGAIRYANGDNSLRFVTDNSERAIITSGGNFGIGTSFPNKNLEIQGTSSGVAADAVIRLRDQYSGTWFANTDNSAIEFYSADTNGPGAGVRSKIANTVEDTTGAAQALTFWTTQNTGGSTLTERLRITSSGNVGIGTQSPASKLHLYSASGDTKLIIEADPTNTNEDDNPYIVFRQDGGLEEAAIWKGSLVPGENNNKLYISNSTSGISAPSGGIGFLTASNNSNYANGIERMTITEAGRVGIGSATPTALLDVSSDVLRLRTAKTPSSAGDTGNTGDICWDANYVYVCIATNTWKRSPLSTW